MVRKKKEKKFLTKPKAELRSVSSTKALKSFAEHSKPLVKEVEEKVVERDDRSLHFKKEMIKERKWLS